MNKFQPSFSAGELAPAVRSRTDIAKHASGLSTCRNFIPKLEGGVSRRTGTRYLNTTKTQGDKVRLIPFPVSNKTGYHIEFGDQYCRFYKGKIKYSFDIDSYDLFDPTDTYTENSITTIYKAITLKLNDNKKLYFHTTKTGTMPSSSPFVGTGAIVVLPNTSDNLSVSVVTNTLWIKLADTTPTKNTAKLIQDAIIAEGTYSDIIVTENTDYVADRLASTQYSALDAVILNTSYRAKQTITGDINNTSIFPLFETILTITYDGLNPIYNYSYEVNSEYWEIVGVGSAVPEISTHYTVRDLPDLEFTQSADVLFITHPDSVYELARYSDTSWVLDVFDYFPPPFMLSNSDITHTMTVSAVSGAGVTLTSSTPFFEYTLGSSKHIGAYFKIFHDVDGQSVKKVFAATGSSTSIQCKGTWRIRSFGGTCDLDVDVEKSTDNGSTWENVRTFTIVNTEIDTFGEIEEYALIRLTCTAFTAGNTISLTTEPFSHAGIIEITGATSTTVLTGTVVRNFASTNASDDWAESAWSEYRGFPVSSTFYQDRLCFGGTITEPQNIWKSQTGDYYNFDVSSPLLDSDAISITLNSRIRNNITNLVSLNDIIALTTGDEWRVGAADSGAITPTNIAANVQGNRGSANIAPVLVGNKIIYPQASSGIIRDLGYDFNSNSFTGENISILSAHLFAGYSIVEMAYAQEPNSTIYMVRSDGKLITLTYLKEQEITGYAIHDTNGLFESVSVIVNDNKYEVWVVVKRGDDRFIEVFEEIQDDVEDQWYLDSALSYGGVAATIISGLDHLEGKTVDALANGGVVKDLVVTSGDITLPNAASKVIVGLRYISDFESLPLTFELQSGTTKDKKSRIPQVSFVFENTRGGWVGDPDIGTITDTSHENTLTESVQARTFMDLPIDLFSGQVLFDINSSWGLNRKIFYRQYDPLPTNILAIIPRVKIGG